MSVRFPAKPTESDQEAPSPIGTLRFKMAMVAEADRAFLATAVIYPVKSKFDAKVALDGARDQMLANIKAKITSEKSIKLDGYDGREVVFEAPGPTGKSVRGSARLFASAKPPGVYMAAAMQMTDKADPDAPRFLTSMHLGKKVETK
jgi:hypothetical protein